MSINDRIEKLRGLMAERGIDAYIIPSSDYHQSEYVGEFFKCRQYITGFTGSAGTAVVTMDEAGLWTDGRYFIQAEKQLSGSEVKLFKMGEPDVPTVSEYLGDYLKSGQTLGFDGRTLDMHEGNEYEEMFKARGVKIEYSYDLVGEIWDERPELSKEPVFVLEEKYSGESVKSKLKRTVEIMKEKGATHHILATIDDCAWTFNIRGNDVMYSPLVLCYSVIESDRVHLFIDSTRLDSSVLEHLEENEVILHGYNDIYEWIKGLGENDVCMIDPDRINYALYNNIPANVKRVFRENPAVLFKALKNDVELENIKNAHIKDGIAHTKFMYWVKNNYDKEALTELSCEAKLEEFRKMQDGYLWQSFAPICAFKDHAAMMHYSSSEATDVALHEGALFLTDTGGNYFEGSTDITRTVALGEVSDELKKHFTAVVRGMIDLSMTRFLYGCTGLNLDAIVRAPIWSLDIDFKCGSGHGIGYMLNIHEAPTGFRWYKAPGKHESHPLEASMVLTNEPGIYIEGSHGIRIENEMIVRNGAKNEFGQFMYFEAITLCPIDLDAIVPEQMSQDEREYLNNYHRMVYDKLSPYMSDEERDWLKKYTRSI